MAYQTGSFTNSHELVNIIYGFLLGNGWTHVAALQSDAAEPDGYDHVFYSAGPKGNTDIYIRVAAGLGDRVSNGLIQHPYDDGYTEYVNTFAYQHFPSTGTSAADGYNEIGRYGPVLYSLFDGDGTWFEHNLFTSGTGPKIAKVLKTRDTTFIDTRQGGLCSFDGGGKIYQSDTGGNLDLRVFNLIDNTLDVLPTYSAGDGQERSMMGRKRDGSPYIVFLNNDSDLGERSAIYDINSDTWSLKSGPSTFTTQNTYGFTVQGPRRKRFINGQPGHQFGYQAQGSSSTRWVYYNFEEQTWSESDIATALPYTVGVSARMAYGVYVMKEKSGYSQDRIYIFRGGNSQDDFSSIAVGDDGYVTGSWATHAVTPVNHFAGHRAFHHGKYMFWHGSDGELYRWELPTTPTSAGSWEIVSMESYFLPESDDHDFEPGGVFDVHDHLCSRVHVNEFETNTYWLIGSSKHLVIVVKDADGNYNYTYTGNFDPYTNDTSTRITETALAGSRTITVDEPVLFNIGESYMIFETKGQYGETIESVLTGDQKLVAPSEFFTVTGKTDNVLQITGLRYSYSTGAVVGEDPVPVMVRAHSIERAQTFNNISLYQIDNFKDPAWQAYDLGSTVKSSFRTSAFEEERDDKVFLFPIILRSGYDGSKETNVNADHLLLAPPSDRPMIGKELRGQLSGVYEASSSVTSETVIPIGSKNYLAFSIQESGATFRTIVVGPIN